ncbi:hypothetical protein JM80_3163 [Cellulophaga sp. RHA_52]|uniref:hypothetical protein n=1 Tax=Cellulophaga sp. RHA_52 TaxID=1250036 RepID=UPI0011996900|nr:hypothetical protein [Cellulophaga sp. RHA_52]TVZ10610.1 hypothetical protein JM80_3163 [Cellulophaga sp. RHA_52]
MKYYSLKIKSFNPEIKDELSDGPKIYPSANGEKISNSNGYLSVGGKFGKIFFEKTVDDAPIFDYFYLYNLTYQKEYDWILLDAYSYIGQNVPSCRGFLVSEKLKRLLEKFDISEPFRFYESRLMFKGKKLKYYIFHLAQNEWENLIFNECEYFEINSSDSLKKIPLQISNSKEFKALFKQYKGKTSKLNWKLTIKNYSDIFYMPFIEKGGYIISETLKNEIIKNDLIDFEIEELENVKFKIKSA